MKSTDITFLHTADVHVKTFSNLLKKSKSTASVKHIVNTEILDCAVKSGITKQLENEVCELLITEALHSNIVVCTCSTLGGIAEKVAQHSGLNILRIDREMADIAVNSGKQILVLAALESTLQPTKRLMQSSQALQGTNNTIDYMVVEDSWDYFLAGQQHLYLSCIAAKIEKLQARYDCIVLAQASMAGAASLINKKGPLILSSPELGVDALLQKLVQQTV